MIIKSENILLIVCFLAGITLLTLPHADVLIQTFQENPEYFYISTSVGTSMYPTIKQGDTLLIMEKEHPDFSISIGDIIVYMRGESAIAHRVVGTQACCGYLVKGDNNNNITELINYNQITGKVVEIRR